MSVAAGLTVRWKNKGCVVGVCLLFVFGCERVVYGCLRAGCVHRSQAALLCCDKRRRFIATGGKARTCLFLSVPLCLVKNDAVPGTDKRSTFSQQTRSRSLCIPCKPTRGCLTQHRHQPETAAATKQHTQQAYTCRHTTGRHCLPVSAPQAQATPAPR